ncbi:GDSL esterase/lipase [Artemisia annua]|uniref:GDSL esterase/lipase n=1 Tax=Artemisia annua TaxID=35608 RepID=A0A2U1KDU6_ARTAN|nr:GDSL esterase/lipase [Artemisia annua]
MGIVKTSPWRLDVLVLVASVLALSSKKGDSQPLVPAMFIFGDSVVDVGNNNNLETLVKSNFPPYGRDFIHNQSTGRFCNGKLASDFTGENLGFTTYPPPILSKEANGKNLLLGANFASGGSGYYETTAEIYGTISLSKQLEYYKEYQKKLVGIAGKFNATSIITGSVYLLSSGSSDFVQNYYVNPLLYEEYTPYQFSDILIQAYSHFIQMNKVAEYFNKKLNATSLALKSKLSGVNIVVLDIYKPLYDLVQKPTDYGFFEARKACCGTGLVETSYLCNKESPGTCKNASEYVFWDGFHPSEAANKLISDDLLVDGIALVS